MLGVELKKGGELRCPDLGDFVVHEHKGRNAMNIITGKVEYLGPRNTVKFRPHAKMKEFFYGKDKKKVT